MLQVSVLHHTILLSHAVFAASKLLLWLHINAAEASSSSVPTYCRSRRKVGVTTGQIGIISPSHESNDAQ